MTKTWYEKEHMLVYELFFFILVSCQNNNIEISGVKENTLLKQSPSVSFCSFSVATRNVTMTSVARILFVLDGAALARPRVPAALGGPPQPGYLVTAGLGARLAHGDAQRGAGRQKPALFAVGGHLLGLPVMHHLYPHAL